MNHLHAIPTVDAGNEPAMSAHPPVFTAAAAARVRELALEQGDPAFKLRITVSGGGCSGLQYGFEPARTVAPDDLVLERDGAVFLVDAMSQPFLLGAEVDYADSLKGARFVIRNPNAAATCGCGASFTA